MIEKGPAGGSDGPVDVVRGATAKRSQRRAERRVRQREARAGFGGLEIAAIKGMRGVADSAGCRAHDNAR